MIPGSATDPTKSFATLTSSSKAPLVQAAGHGLLRLSETRVGAVVKPTTANEARFYGFVTSDPSFAPLRRFLPNHYRTAPLQVPDPEHPTHTHEVEIENLCLLDGVGEPPRSSDEDGTTDAETGPGSLTDTPRLHGSGRGLSRSPQPPPSGADFAVEHGSSHADDSSLGHRDAMDGSFAGVPKPDPTLPAPMSSQHRRASAASAAARAADAVAAKRTQWSAPSVLDMKLGRIRHGPQTRPEKVAHIIKKDAGTTGPVLAVRLCGLRHERRVLEDVDAASLGTSYAGGGIGGASLLACPSSPFNDPLSREDSMCAVAAHDDRPSDEEEDEACGSGTHHSALRYYETMQARRPEPSPAVPIANDAGGQPRRRRRRRVMLGRRYEWIEGKALGRRADRAALVEALARFCTCVELAPPPPQVGLPMAATCGGAAAAYATTGVAGGSFQPQPHLPLVRYYRDEASALLAAIDASEVLTRYSFVSSSAILVHDFHVKVPPASAAGTVEAAAALAAEATTLASGTAFDEDLIAFRAQLRVVDFSSSGALRDACVYPDMQVGFRDGIVMLVDLLSAVVAEYGPASNRGL